MSFQVSKRSVISFILGIAFVSASYCIAADCPNPDTPIQNTDILNPSYLWSIPGDFVTTIQSPFQAKTAPHWSDIAVMGGVTWYLMANDKNVSDSLRGSTSSMLNDVLKFGNLFGDAPTLFPGLGITYIVAAFSNDKRLEETALLSFKGVLISGTITQGIKFIAQRHRPVLGDPNRWDGPSLNSDDDTKSFPSGHATAAWTVATIVANEYSDQPIIPILAYSIATTTCLARVQMGDHWASDVFVGAVIGHWVGKLIFQMNHQSNGVCVYPVFGNGDVGLITQFSFN